MTWTVGLETKTTRLDLNPLSTSSRLDTKDFTAVPSASAVFDNATQRYSVRSMAEYILCLKKESHLMFDNNFGNVDRFSTFFHQMIRRKSLYVCTTKNSTWKWAHVKLNRFVFHLTCNTLLHYPCEIRKSKNVMEFSCWMWQLICFTKI